MADVESVWTDKQIETSTIVFLVISLFVIFILPLIPIVFNKIDDLLLYFLKVYPVIFVTILLVGLYIYLERMRLLYTATEGVVMRWALETGNIVLLIKWDNIKRISVINSWSPKNYFRWKKIRKDLSIGLILKSFIGSRMMIIETVKDKVYFVEINDWKGFMHSVDKIALHSRYAAEIPVLQFN